MDVGDLFDLNETLWKERKCRSCGKVKDLVDGFYLTRKGRATVNSSYSYECKDCTIKRITKSRKSKKNYKEWEYPDWQVVHVLFPHLKTPKI